MTQRSRDETAVMPGIVLLVSSLMASTAGPVHAQEGADGPRFVTHTIAAELASGYQPVVVDLNRDGRLDIIALSTRLDELAWYENPDWERHVLTTGLNRAINAAARDLDGDGIPELVVAHEFGTTHASSLGVLSLLTHQGDPTEPWSIREIDRTPTVHRVGGRTSTARGATCSSTPRCPAPPRRRPSTATRCPSSGTAPTTGPAAPSPTPGRAWCTGC